MNSPDQQKPHVAQVFLWWISGLGIVCGGVWAIFVYYDSKSVTHLNTTTSTIGTPEEVVNSHQEFVGPTYLSALEERAVGNIHIRLKKNTQYFKTPYENIGIADRSFKSGLGMHAPATGVGFVEYLVPLGAATFESKIGLSNSEPINQSCMSKAQVQFRVKHA